MAVSPLVTVICLSGCSIGPQAAPQPVNPPAADTPAPAPSRSGVPLSVQVYVVQGDHLRRLVRKVSPGAGLQPALSGLATPLSRDEIARGLRSVVPAAGTAMRGEIDGATARVSVPAGFDRASVRDQSLAVAQLVFTITANTLATEVELVQAGRVLPVPDASGKLVTGPVTRLDYAAYRPSGG